MLKSVMSVPDLSTVTLTTLPTIFDILAADDLDNLLKPVISSTLKMAAKFKPRLLSALSNYNDEVALTIKTILEWYFLKVADGSMAEAFYGLQRCPVAINDKFWRLKSIFFLIYIPMFKAKLASYHEDLKLMANDHLQSGGSVTGICRNQFLVWYPVIQGCIKVINIFFLLGYITNRTQFPSLSFFLQRIRPLVTNSIEISKKTYPIYSRIRGWSWRLIQLIVFFLQYYDWWNTNGENSSLISALFSTGVRKVLPPKKDNSNLTLSVAHGLCPICEEPRKVPAVIATTGILGCYECLRDFVEKNETCPITGCPTKLDDVMRLYIS